MVIDEAEPGSPITILSSLITIQKVAAAGSEWSLRPHISQRDAYGTKSNIANLQQIAYRHSSAKQSFGYSSLLKTPLQIQKVHLPEAAVFCHGIAPVELADK